MAAEMGSGELTSVRKIFFLYHCLFLPVFVSCNQIRRIYIGFAACSPSPHVRRSILFFSSTRFITVEFRGQSSVATSLLMCSPLSTFFDHKGAIWMCRAHRAYSLLPGIEHRSRTGPGQPRSFKDNSTYSFSFLSIFSICWAFTDKEKGSGSSPPPKNSATVIQSLV